jgi:hypothetical protein
MVLLQIQKSGIDCAISDRMKKEVARSGAKLYTKRLIMHCHC